MTAQHRKPKTCPGQRPCHQAEKAKVTRSGWAGQRWKTSLLKQQDVLLFQVWVKMARWWVVVDRNVSPACHWPEAHHFKEGLIQHPVRIGQLEEQGPCPDVGQAAQSGAALPVANPPASPCRARVQRWPSTSRGEHRSTWCLKPGEGAEGTSEEGWEKEQVAAEGQRTFQKPLAQLERHQPFMDVQGQRRSFLGEQHDGREGNGWPGSRGHPRAARSPSSKGALEAHTRGMCCPTSPEHCRARRVARTWGCSRSQQGD